jgi:hypothetical protein
VRSTLETIIQVLFKPLESFLIYHHVWLCCILSPS